MSENDAVLFANDAFYQAFDDGDYDALNELWAKGYPVTCIHPGWNPLEGRDMVMATWKMVLSNPSGQRVSCLGPKAVVYGDTAVVTCYEEIGGDTLVASNVFIKENKKWVLVHHQAGPTAMEPAPDLDLEARNDQIN